MTFREMLVEDLDQVVDIEQNLFSVPWTKEAIVQDMTENPRAMYFVADIDGVIVGYVGLWKILDEGHINNVAVLPDYRKRHIGMAMIDTMLRVTGEEGINHHTLGVRAGNKAAKGLYAKFGFCDEGLRKGYYEDNGEDAVIMWRRSPSH